MFLAKLFRVVMVAGLLLVAPACTGLRPTRSGAGAQCLGADVFTRPAAMDDALHRALPSGCGQAWPLICGLAVRG